MANKNIKLEKEVKLENEIKVQNHIRDLEQFYTEGKVDNMLSTLEQKKNELVEDMVKYARDNEKCIKWSKDGDELDYEVKINPIVITNRYFKPITPILGQEPIYNAEKLGMIFDYYCDILAEVNDKIGNFPSSLTSFCKLAGITTTTLRNLKNSADLSMRTVVEKIYDQVGDENITMSQMGIARERTTIFKMKSQNELVEKAQPNININITEMPNMENINARIDKYKTFAKKKGN